jgi:hypothetical protein
MVPPSRKKFKTIFSEIHGRDISPSRHGMKNLQEMIWIHGVSTRSSFRIQNNCKTIFSDIHGRLQEET